MIDLPLLITFIAAASILAATPGVDTAIVLRSSVVDGKKPAIMASIGVALGCLVWGAAVSLGLGALLQASELAYSVVKIVGAAYLVWLGTKLLLKPRTILKSDDGATLSKSRSAAFKQGLLANLLNPKIGIFYVTFLPQFVPTGSSVAAYTFFLASIHVVLSLIWFSILIAATTPLNGYLNRPIVMKTLDRITGGIFVSFGIKLANSSSN